MLVKSKLVRGMVVSLTSVILMGSGISVVKAYSNANIPILEEVKKTDKQKLAVDLETSESYQDMMESSKKFRA